MDIVHVVDQLCEHWVRRNIGAGSFVTRESLMVVRYRKITPYVLVTAKSGTAPTLDVTLEGRYGREFAEDGRVVARGVWIPIYTFPQITAVGNYRQGPFEISELEIRYRVVVGGGENPGFTVTLGNILRT